MALQSVKLYINNGTKSELKVGSVAQTYGCWGMGTTYVVKDGKGHSLVQIQDEKRGRSGHAAYVVKFYFPAKS